MICNGCRKIKNIICSSDNITLYKSGSFIKIYLIKNRIFSILNCIRIIYGEVIQVVCIVTIDRTIFLPEFVVNCLMEYECKEEFSLFTGHSITWILVILLISCKHNFRKCADIHRQIMPTRLINIIIYIFRFHYTNNIVGIKHTITIRVCFIVHLYPTLNIILRNIKPEAYSLCVFKNKRLAINTHSDPSILLGVRILGGKTVCFKTHRIVTVMDLAVGTVSKRQVQFVIPMSCVLSVVYYIPFINI